MATKQKKSEYWQLLRDPRWQKVRLEIMSRDGFACSNCGTKTETLNVHHSYYEKDKMPWEYPSKSLHCLCESCHEKFTELNLEFKRQLGRLHPGDISQLLGYAQAIEAGRIFEWDEPVEFVIRTYEQAEGFCDGYCSVADTPDVLRAVDGDTGVLDRGALDDAEAEAAVSMAEHYEFKSTDPVHFIRVIGIGMLDYLEGQEKQAATC